MKSTNTYKLKITTFIILGLFCILYNATAQPPSSPQTDSFKQIDFNNPNGQKSHYFNSQIEIELQKKLTKQQWLCEWE